MSVVHLFLALFEYSRDRIDVPDLASEPSALDSGGDDETLT